MTLRSLLSPRGGLALAATVLAPVCAHAQRGDAFDARLRPPEEQRALFHAPAGFEVQFVAGEPEIQKPMNLAFDAAGRLWMTGSSLYPWPARRDALGRSIDTFQKNWDDNNLAFRATSTPPQPAENGTDTVRVLSDFGPDGRARKVTIFADGLNIPIGILPLPRPPGAKGDSALVFSIPAIWKLTDTDGDGRADLREKLYDGFGFKDTHGMSSSYWLWFDGWVYGTHGFANASEVTDHSGRVTRLTSGNTYRFRPDGSAFEIFTHGQTNPFGLAFDARGNLFTADSHSKPVYLVLPGAYYEGINKEHDGLGFAPPITTDDHGSSAIAGIAHYSATSFPREFHDNLFNGNPVTRRINRARLDWRGSSPSAARQADFLTSDDPSFRPVQVKLGPDGALWIADFYNPIIGHYEVPLTHPSRDRAHGRIWRVVWRGLNHAVTPPPPPDLTRLDTPALAGRVTDPNLVVRSLAVTELLVRADGRSATPVLRDTAARLIDGTDPQADETAVFPLLATLERLGEPQDALLALAFQRPDSSAAAAALRVLETRATLPPAAEQWFATLIDASPKPDASAQRAPGAAPGHAWRIIAQLLARHPRPWAAPQLLAMQGKAPEADFELTYALRLALKAQAQTADVNTLHAWAGLHTANADRIADACLAVSTPAAAHFLLAHLERTKFASPRAGDFARHAVQQLPADEFAAVTPVLRSLENAPRPQRFALAEGLALVAAKPDRTLPADIEAWMRREVLAAIEDKDAALALRAINAAKPIAWSALGKVLQRVALEPKARESNRIAALRALPADTPATETTLLQVLAQPGSNALRRAAAEQLGTALASAKARSALVDAIPTASADLSLALVLALARSDAGAEQLLGLAAAGRVRPALLGHRHVILAFEKRSSALREKLAALTKSLPPEDARLDAVIAQRMGAAASFKPDPQRGAALFAQQCATCHRFRNNGGNIGPSLDGISSRSQQRIVEDILDPSRNIDPAFRLTTVTLKNGETRSGMNYREESNRVLLLDPATGQDVVIARGEVRESTPSPVSAMPAAFETVFSEAEFFDLLAYLREPTK